MKMKMKTQSDFASVKPVDTYSNFRSAIKPVMLVALSTTALVAFPSFSRAQDALVTSSNIAQIDHGVYTNDLNIDATGAAFFLNSAGTSGVVQDSLIGQNTLDVTLSDTNLGGFGANLIFVSQLGDVTQTLTIDGSGNTAILMDFGGTTTINDVISITGDNNTVDLKSTALFDAHTNLGVTLAGDNIVLDVTIDDFAELVVNLTGDGDNITVVQQHVSTDVMTIGAPNVAIIDISGAVAGNVIGNIVNILQTGVNNVLDFDLAGDGNTITVTQTNDAVGKNDLRIDLNDDDATLAINANGEGYNTFIVSGTGNDLTVNSDTLATGFTSTDAEAYILVNGNDNVVNALNYADVAVVVGEFLDAHRNDVRTTGDAIVYVDGDDSTVIFSNGFELGDYVNRAQIIVNSTQGLSTFDNNIALYNVNTALGTQTSYNAVVTGNGNTTGTGGLTVDNLVEFSLSITGDDNSVEGYIGIIDGLVDVAITGDNNGLEFVELVGPSASNIAIDLVGDGNLFSVTGDYADLDLYIRGTANDFDYDLGNPLTHSIGGSDFAGSVTASVDGESYVVDYTDVGDGFSKITSGSSSMIIKSNCGTYTEVSGVGTCS